MLDIIALFMHLEPLPGSKGNIVGNDKGNHRYLFKSLPVSCVGNSVSLVFKDPSVWRRLPLSELQAHGSMDQLLPFCLQGGAPDNTQDTKLIFASLGVGDSWETLS